MKTSYRKDILHPQMKNYQTILVYPLVGSFPY